MNKRIVIWLTFFVWASFPYHAFTQTVQPLCTDESFGHQKTATETSTYSEGTRFAKPFIDSKEAKGPFAGRPLEIATIQNGAYSEFVGSHLNDGSASWLAIDIDSKKLVWITRSTHHKRSALTRPYRPYKIKDFDRVTVVRTWESEDGERKEEEVIRTDSLSNAELQIFICVANVDWRKASSPSASFRHRQ
jgi:hypothetical protein